MKDDRAARKRPRRLLGGWWTGTLDEPERRELLRAALDDQETFDALLDDESLRELLEDPNVRARLRNVPVSRRAWQRVRDALDRRATWRDLVVAAASLVLATLVVHSMWLAAPEGRDEAAASLELHERLFSVAPQVVTGAELELAGPGETPRVSPGEPLRLAFRLGEDGQALVLARAEGGAIEQLFPPAQSSRDQPPATVQAARVRGGVRVMVLDRDGRPSRAPRSPGLRRLRLVVFPIDVDPLRLAPADLPALVPRLTIVERRYEVIDRRDP